MPALCPAQTIDATDWHGGTVGLTQGWVTHAGDNPDWSQPNFDDSAWKRVEIDDLGAARPGWRWFRVQVKLAPDHPPMRVFIAGGRGTYEVYVNGALQRGAGLRSALAVERPTEQVFSIGAGPTDLELALRTHTPWSYSVLQLPLFLNASLGTALAIDNERVVYQSRRLYSLLLSLPINLAVLLAGIGCLGLFLGQREHAEYRWLGLYLLLLGLSNLLWESASFGAIPIIWTDAVGDPLIYVFTIMQIEFTFSFTGRQIGRAWRAYELALLSGLVFATLAGFGVTGSTAYFLIEAFLVLPAALLLPVLLFLWYRKGNREAGWLILPSLLPAAITSVFDIGTVSIYTGWGKLDFLDNPIPLGPVSLQLSDLGNLLFLVAIVIVIFFRFTRVSREQARGAAELDAAREMQRRMVPLRLPEVIGYSIEAAYLPASEVGGDFYQVLEQSDGATLVVVGDVSGKGLQAAMTGTLALGALRTLAAENLGPAALLARLNRQVVSAHESGFITCVCVRIAPDGRASAANAGHLIPYRNGEEIQVDSGLPLGITADAEYVEAALRLAPGDRLTLLSDGVVEAMGEGGELFGFERTRSMSRRPAAEIAEAARQFGQSDDITVLTLTLTGAGVVHA
ncbi:MAG: PP2C family protein-serine/threonine phosphatase [Acidobacteriaceae bacterium]